MFENMDKGRKLALIGIGLLLVIQSGLINVNFKVLPQNSAQETSDVIPKPSEENIQKCAELTELFKKNSDLAYDSAYFYMAFSDVIVRNPHDFVGNNEDFKRYNEIALDYMFENNPATGKIEGLGEKIDQILMTELGDDPTKEIDNKKLSDLLYAIGWTAYNAI